MGKFTEVITRLRQWNEQEREYIEDRKSGTVEDFEFHGDKRVNVTKKSIEDAEAKMARNERLIKDYEKHEE